MTGVLAWPGRGDIPLDEVCAGGGVRVGDRGGLQWQGLLPATPVVRILGAMRS